MSWHHLVPLHHAAEYSWEPLRSLDAIFRSLAQEPARLAHIRCVRLDCRHLCHTFASPEALVQVLSLLRPERLLHVALDLPWRVVGDPRVLQVLATFRHVRRLFLHGVKTSDVFFGIDSRGLRTLREGLAPGTLSHLSVDGFGVHSSFTFRSLAKLLEAHPHLTTLSLGFVRGGIALPALAALLPHLRSLTLVFSTPFQLEANVEWAAGDAAALGDDPGQELLPRLTGDLADFQGLRHVGLRCKPGTTLGLSRIRELLDSLAHPHLLTHLCAPDRIRGNSMELVSFAIQHFEQLEVLAFGTKVYPVQDDGRSRHLVT